MGGGSKSSSASTSSSRTNTSTQNLSLNGVDGVTVAGSKSVTVNMASKGAFGIVGEALKALEASQASALNAVSANSSRNLDTISKTLTGSLQKINTSNQTGSQKIAQQITQISVAGLVVWGVTKVWGKK